MTNTKQLINKLKHRRNLTFSWKTLICGKFSLCFSSALSEDFRKSVLN